MRTINSPAVRGRQVVQAAVLAGAAVGLLAACASPGTQSAASAPGGTAAPSSGTSHAAISSAAATAGPATAGPATAGLATCASASLRITVNTSQAGGAAGSTYYPVNFTNTSGSACRMYGYPGMSFVTADGRAGRQIGAAAQQNPGFTRRQVRLAAGGSAHAWLQVTQAANYPASTCLPVTAHWLRVYAPGEKAALYVGHSFAACSSAKAPLLTVMPVRAGQGVQGSTP